MIVTGGDSFSSFSKNKQILSRLSITGPVHSNTPLCVLLEIADAHGIKYDLKDDTKLSFVLSLIDSIIRTEVPTIKTVDNDLGELQHVARFVNKHHAWPQAKLLQAYNFLMQFSVEGVCTTFVPKQFTFGPQTPADPTAVNACVLYQICVHNRLNVTSHTTIQQMAQAVKLLRSDIEPLVRMAELFVKRDAKRVDLINILMLASHEVIDPEIPVEEKLVTYYGRRQCAASHDILTTLHESLNDKRSLQNRIEPTTEPGAVALAAINYGIDLSYATSPLREYKLLKLAGRDHYEPAEHWLKYWFHHNITLFDLQLTFNPIYPQDFYSREQLTIMTENEGYTSRDLAQSDAIELLQLAQLSPTFYEGPLPNLEILETPIDLDDVDAVPYGELLSYGCLNGNTKPITIMELTTQFDNSNAFSTPYIGESQFPRLAINKLKLLLQNLTHYRRNTDMPEQTMRRREQLLRVIERIEFYLANNDGTTLQLLTYHRNANPTTKLAMITCLTELMRLGMYMRGWDGQSTTTYPIKQAPVPPEQQGRVAVNVTDAIRRYESSIKSLGTIGTYINGLPLVRYRNAQFQTATNSTDGLTIGERVNIVKTGDVTSNVASCIRLSSNWLCASAYKYLMSLGIAQPFDIFHLAYVS